MQGNKNALAGIDILRKVCNHPDLLQRAQWETTEGYGAAERSGKLTVALKVCSLAHTMALLNVVQSVSPVQGSGGCKAGARVGC